MDHLLLGAHGWRKAQRKDVFCRSLVEPERTLPTREGSIVITHNKIDILSGFLRNGRQPNIIMAKVSLDNTNPSPVVVI